MQIAKKHYRFPKPTPLSLYKRSLMTYSKDENQSQLLQKFPFETNNNEFYWAKQSNAVHQSNRLNFRGNTYQNQAQLPSLPIPDLKVTLNKYLKTIEPFINSSEELEQQKLLIQNFLQGMGPILQNRLIQFSNDKRNWLSTFWDEQAYLQYNDPVVPYVSYFFSHKPLPMTHAEIEKDPLVKATAIIMTVVKFIEALKDEILPPELIRKVPFCMNSFQLMFNNSRKPGQSKDSNVFYSIYENNFMIISFKGNFFRVSTHDTDGKPLSANNIWQQLYSIVTLNVTQQDHIGCLTSLPRDEWRKSYAQLINDPISKKSLETIYKSSFILCLDLDETPITLESQARNSWHGNGFNRFYDKPLQFIVCGNGHSGFLAEHSKMDGTPNLFLNNYIMQQLSKLSPREFLNQIVMTPNEIYRPELLPFAINTSLQRDIKLAKTKFKQVMGQHDLKVWQYKRYGKNFMKKHKISPDAYIQQIIQLAIYKYLGRQLPTYEAASTRMFFKGRTETGRVVTTASSQFVRTWEDPNVALSEKINLFKQATADHSAYLKEAASGNGVDRHFFGLKNMLQDGENVPLFDDLIFNYSSTWLVSTSQLSSEFLNGYGWSQVNDIGVGLAYMINNDWLHINIVCKPEFSLFDVNELHYILTEAADELGEALETVHLETAKL
ncbi:hypothetical protein KAFR_0C05330 [Kazachstania africana CBS 2517]|uniref:Carnitine O-acetyltransferase, mitochondrial n=1 Tax=Kazachstania africana (strain ATCC 22294 / BCRC 22015 / CBS 2517 / CECT 1963 / NBRC 1671 / NRRL Y-8276) TaxID=1071382 RepID=H2AT24_KAZAF|nr:hypothetical protein KAFR_0C05330 [Kazachstania africana CBS 2517]CCF57524.1 hypothetical protein KAFR_0C05330 [Kazachstania africana CBS 2517]